MDFETEHHRPMLMLVPRGANAEQMNRIQSALQSGELRNGMEWLVEQDIVDEPLAADYRVHFKDDVLGDCFGIEPRFHDHVLRHCENHYKKVMMGEVDAFLDGDKRSI